MTQPLVSIIMTSYNAEKHIEEAINSILDQSYSNWELLFADDCSTDNTREIVQTFADPRIRIYNNEKHLHYLRTRNKLAPLAKGDLITFLDADDKCDPTRLEKQVNKFLQDPDLGMCGTLVSYIDKKGDPVPVADQKPLDYDSIKRAINQQNVFTGSTIMVKTKIWNNVGGYRDYFNSLGYEDYDLTSRIVESYKAINLNEPLYIYRQYPGSSSKQHLIFNPFKLHGYLLVQKFIAQRAKGEKDSLERNDIPEIINFIVEANRPYVIDPSLIYRNLMWSHLNRRMRYSALKYVLKALWIKPFYWINWKTLGIYLLAVLGIIKE